MIDAAIEWAKEYGDVLGAIGFMFAMFTVVITNGKLILQRMRGETPDVPFAGISAGAVTMPSAHARAQGTDLTVDAPPQRPDYGDKKAIAILPPKEMGDLNAHFSEGLVEDMIADLQRADFAVPDPSTVAEMAFKGLSTTNIARNLGVEHVLSTSIRCQEEKIRITVKLVDPSGAVAWSERLDAEGSDQLAIQETTAHKVAAAVSRTLKPSNQLRNPETGAVYKNREEALAAIASPKSRLVALLLCTPPLGILGIHRFYLGRPFTGLLYTLTLGLMMFGWLIDTILILLGIFADGKGRPVRIWHRDPLEKLKSK